MRWPETEGEAVCPRGGCAEASGKTTRRKFKCHHRFGDQRDDLRLVQAVVYDLLAALVDRSAFPRCKRAVTWAFNMRLPSCCSKLGEAMGRELAPTKLDGTVEIDSAYFAGYVKPENNGADHKDRRCKINLSGKRQCVVIMRERKGAHGLSYS
jgi:hypothetical protein